MTRSAVGCLFIAVAVGLAGCSSTPTATTTTTAASTTTSTGVPRLAVYRLGTAAVQVAFPGTPVVDQAPAELTAVLPAHTTVTAWNVGDLGAFEDNSYELVMAEFPPGATTASIDTFLTNYSKAPNSTMFGNPALHELSTIPFSTGTRYSGITAFSVDRFLVLAVAFDSVKADVVRFLGSLQLVSPRS